MLSKEQNIAVQPKIALEDLLTRCTDYDDMSLSMDAGELKALKQHISLLESSASTELLSMREQLAELKASIGFNVGDRVCDSVDKLGYGYVVSINNGRSEYPISVQFDKSDKGRISTYTADGRKLSGCPVCLYKTPSVTAANPAED
ncbi:TPA: hypothetical protein ACJ2X1_003904 [Yersinia enterocolitica]